MKFKIYSKDGSKASEKEIAFSLLEGDKGKQALKDTLTAYAANARQGNASTKNFGEVKGTGKKPFRQKGTGGARHGSRRSPIHRKGAVVFGPRPRDWSKKINAQVKLLAFYRALSEKVADGEVSLIEGFELSAPKTKEFAAVLKRIYPEGRILVLDGEISDSIERAGRNIARLYMGNAKNVNAMDLVYCDKLLVSEAAFAQVLARIQQA